MSAIAEARASTVSAQTPPRVDLYATIHKALRLFMTDTLARVGRLDIDDARDVEAALHQLDGLLEICRRHLAHENEFVHTAIEARRPGLTSRIAAEHEEHLDAMAALGAEASSLRATPTAAAAHRLYRHLALFVAANLEHMNVEETAHNEALWAHYDDAGLIDIEQRLVASIDPQEMGTVLRWMAPAINPGERAALFGAIAQTTPPEGMRDLFALVRPHLDDAAWAKLGRAMRAPSMVE